MSLLFIYANTNYSGDNEQIIPDYKDATVMSNHRLTQLSLCRFNASDEKQTVDILANFLRCGDATEIETSIFRKTLQYSQTIPEIKKQLNISVPLLANETKLQIYKKTSHIISSDAKIDNFDIHKLEQNLFDKLGIPFASIAADVAAEINSAQVIVGFNIDYHLNVLRYELGLLDISINDPPKICLSCICRELTQNPSITKAEMCQLVGFTTAGFYDSMCNCLACAKLLFSLIENRQIIL